jgi:hypothetical protein
MNGEQKLSVYEKRVPITTFTPKENETPAGLRRKCIMKNFVIFVLSNKYFLNVDIKKDQLDGESYKHRQMENTYNILVGKLQERNHSDDLSVNGKIITNKSMETVGVNYSGLKPVEPFRKYGEFLDWTNDNCLLKDSTPRS